MRSYGKLHCHERVRAVLSYALESNTLAHAYLFSGNDGVGKQTLAWHFAAALLCGAHTIGDECTCSHCHKVAQGVHADLLWIGSDEEVRSIKIEDIRAVQSWAMLKPLEASKKLCIINQAERMTEEAANAFLKTLEEPPAHTYIVVLAENVYQLPQTILSRLIELRLPPLSYETLVTVLRDEYGCGEEAHYLAYQAQGSLGRALALRDSDDVKEKNDIIDALIGPQCERFLLGLAQARSGSVEKVLTVLLSFMHDVLLHKTGTQDRCLVHQERRQESGQMSKRCTLTEIVSLLEVCEEGKRSLDGNVNQKLLAGHLAVRMSALAASSV